MPVAAGKTVFIEEACTSDFMHPPLTPGTYTFVVTWESLVGSPSVSREGQASAAVEIVQ